MSETIHTNVFLTNFATRTKVGNPIADFIAPPFKVKRSADKYVIYGDDQNRIWDNKVSGREIAKEIQWDVTEGTYSCEEYSIEKYVNARRAENADAPITYDKEATKRLKIAQQQAREWRVHQIAGNSAIVGSTAIGAGWATPATGTPVADIMTAKGVVWARTGDEPNRIVIPGDVALQMILCDEWKEYFKYTNVGFGKGLFSAIDGLRNIGLEPMIADIAGLSTAKGTASDPAKEMLWGDDVLVFYAEESPTLESRSFMYSPYTVMNQIQTVNAPRERGKIHVIYENIDELLVTVGQAQLLTNVI